MSSLIVKSYPAEATSTIDGTVSTRTKNWDWAAIRADEGNAAYPTDTTFVYSDIAGSSTSGKYLEIDRGVLLFYISALPAGATITDIKLYFYVQAKTNGLEGEASDNSKLVLCKSIPASDTNLVGGDFDGFDTTDFGRSAKQADLTLNAYNSIALNQAGLDYIDTVIAGNGIARLGLKYGWDFDNLAPFSNGATWHASSDQNIYGPSADAESNQPYLEITYSTGETAAYTPLPLTLTIPSITASFLQVVTAAFTPLSFLLTVPANTATYVYERVASFTSLSLRATIPAITASFVSVFTAVFSAVSLVFRIPVFRHWVNQSKSSPINPTNQTKHSISPTNQTKHSITPKNQDKH